MSGMTTGLSPATFTRLQLNAGAFLINFDVDEYATVAALKSAIVEALTTGEKALGATRGGGTFQCTPTMRSIEADGKRAEFVGSTVNDGWTVKLTTTLLEITPENFKRALISADIEAGEGGKKIVKIRTRVADTDYIPTLCWVGDSSNGLVIIELTNALNLTGANFTFTDKGEGTLPVEFQAHQADLLAQDYAPCRVIFLVDEAAAAAASATTGEQPAYSGEEPAGEAGLS